jgi:hypothetical protein
MHELPVECVRFPSVCPSYLPSAPTAATEVKHPVNQRNALLPLEHTPGSPCLHNRYCSPRLGRRVRTSRVPSPRSSRLSVRSVQRRVCFFLQCVKDDGVCQARAVDGRRLEVACLSKGEVADLLGAHRFFPRGSTSTTCVCCSTYSCPCPGTGPSACTTTTKRRRSARGVGAVRPEHDHVMQLAGSERGPAGCNTNLAYSSMS